MHRLVGATTVHPHQKIDVTTRAAFNSARVQYIGGANGDEPVTIDSFTTLDARAAWHLRTQLTLFLGVNNILNAGTPVDTPLEPRTAYAGVSGSYL
jgi:outer membrane receptor protein involved in Fe transport